MLTTIESPATGKVIDSSMIEAGLRALNTDINFDVANRLGDWSYLLEQPSSLRAITDASRQPVLYQDHYVAAMDRGPVPEFKQWSVKEVAVEVEWADADKDEASIQYVIVNPWDANYQDLYLSASFGQDDKIQILADGRLARMRAMGVRKVRDRVVRLGWRHTFEAILRYGINGVTRQSIAAQFAVDMLKFPVGAPEELVAELVEE
jgi:hypothetical protein